MRVISSEEMDFPEGQQSVQVELRASGYNVTIERSLALEPGKLLDDLQSSTPSEVVASVAVVRLGRGGIAYVWLPESAQMYRVTSSETEVDRAANVLSLRVTELISLRGSGYAAERSAPGNEPKAPVARPETKEKTPNKPWFLWAALGPQLGSGLKSPLASARMGLNRSAGDVIAFEVGGHLSLGAASQRFEQGDIRISDKGLSASALLHNKGQLRWQFGPIVGLRCVRIKSEPRDGTSALSQNICGSTVGALLRLGVSFDPFSLWISGLSSVGTRRIDLLADGEILATLGRPDGWLGLMIGRQF